MFGGKLFRTLVLGGIAATGCSASNAPPSQGRGGSTVDAAPGGAGEGGLGGGGAGTTGGAAGAAGGMAGAGGTGEIAGAGGTGSIGAGGTSGASGTGGASGISGASGSGGSAGNSDASVIPDATIDGAACCPPECEGHQCACAGGSCCWLVTPGQIPGCAKACFPHG
jgi:hypothetical protein